MKVRRKWSCKVGDRVEVVQIALEWNLRRIQMAGALGRWSAQRHISPEIRPGCPGLYPSLKPVRMETAQPPWAACSAAWAPASSVWQGEGVLLYPVSASLVFSLHLLPSSKHHWIAWLVFEWPPLRYWEAATRRPEAFPSAGRTSPAPSAFPSTAGSPDPTHPGVSLLNWCSLSIFLLLRGAGKRENWTQYYEGGLTSVSRGRWSLHNLLAVFLILTTGSCPAQPVMTPRSFLA